jgi:signal transduction histidine kinase
MLSTITRRKQILFYLAAVIVPILALLLRQVLEREYGELPHYVLFYPVVLLVAVLGDAWAGLLATTTTALLVIYWVLPPVHQFTISRTNDAIGLAIFCVMGVGISVVAELYHRNRETLATYQKEQAVLVERRTADARYRMLFNSIDEGFCTIEVLFNQNGRPNDWRFLEVNPAFGRHYGLEHVTGKTIRELIPNIETRWFDIYGKVAITGEAIRFVEFSQPLNRWFDLYAFRIGEPEQHRVAVLFSNITESKQAEEALRQSEERFRALVMAGSDVMYRMSPDWSEMRQLRSQHFLADTEAPSRTWLHKYIHPDDQSHVLAVINEAIRTKSIFELEHRALCADGSMGWTFSRAIPVLNANGEIAEWLGTASDVTERKRAEEALLRSEKLASVGRMAVAIAHEINNPLEAVTNLLFITKEIEGLPESARHFLETADAELRRIAHMTRQSLGFYRESNAPALTSVNAVLESTVDLLNSKIKAKHAMIEKQWDGDVQVTAVAGELRQVFSNLLVNSLDAIDEKGTIKLRVTANHRCVRVTVADNGKGISASVRQHIFEPFFTTKGTVGTGLGLWVSKQIIEKHDGVIQMHSTVHRGTVFSVVLRLPPRPNAVQKTD